MSASSISVTVRVRPFSIREAAQLTRPDDAPAFFGDGSLAGNRAPKLSGKGVRRVVKVIDENMLVFDPAEENPMARYQKTILPQGKRVKDMRFGFDRVFDENCTQQDVYEASTKSLLDSVLDGFNATVFAYGATGCGKTHTISGTPQQPGIIFLTCAELFERIRELQDEKDINLTLSYLEIYNETIRDLLVPGGSKIGLQLREDNNSNIAVAGLSTHSPSTVEQVMDMIVMGNANRTMSPTEANATSSRSHAVLQISVTQKPRTAGLQEDHIAATLSIIDLAGSERASVTKNRGERLLEGANINRSLLALGNCINALCDPAKKNHVPYRDSKLTRLLKFSLGGNCKTVMIVCVSPSSAHYDETHNTLKYANRAKNIKTKVSRNMINVNRHVSQYVKAIYDLRQEVDSLKMRLTNSTKEAMEKIRKQNVSKDASITEGLRRIRLSYEQSRELRQERINDMLSLRVIERRMALVTAWITSFDEVFQAAQPSSALGLMRREAQKVLQEMEDNRVFLQQRLAGQGWERIIESALQNALRNLSSIEGVEERDKTILSTEANLQRLTGERDVLHALAQADVDVSTAVHTLAKAHYETVTTLHRIMESDLTEAEAFETARKSLFDIQQGASDALSHIIKPNGELVSTQIYQPSSFSSPKKRRHAGSPVKAAQSGGNAGLSPAKNSPRNMPYLAKSPRKAFKFNKKSPAPKKRVRFQEDLEDFAPSVESRVLFEDVTPAQPVAALEEPVPQSLPASALAESEPSSAESNSPHGLHSRPIRPPRNSRFEAGFLSKPKDSPPVSSATASSTDSPLQSFDVVDQVINRLKPEEDPHSSSDENSKPWRAGAGLAGRQAMRKSTSGATRHAAKKRSPSNSAQTSPENTTQWSTSHNKRLPKGTEKENNGSMTSVLSPHVTGIKASARRMTTSSTGSLKLSSAALASLKDQGTAAVGSSRESTPNGVGKPTWR